MLFSVSENHLIFSANNMSDFIRIFLIISILLVADVTASFSQMFSEQNQAGLPSELLVETTDLNDKEQVDKLLAQLETPEFRYAVKHAVLKMTADMGRSTHEDWEDPLLCRYDWLSWLPWLDCDLDKPERTIPPLMYQEEGECYNEL